MASEKQLIDVNDAIRKLEDEISMYEPVSKDDGHIDAYKKRVIPKLLRNVIDWLKNQPIVDAVEVVHGEWISWEKADNLIPSPDRHECSVCHDAAQVLVNGFELLSPYCPNCGAKMDGDLK